MQYKVTSINEDEGTVNVLFDMDMKEQTLTAPIEDKEVLNRFLYEYGMAYERGINKVKKLLIPQDVKDMADKSFEVTEIIDAKGSKVLDVKPISKIEVSPIGIIEENPIKPIK